MSANPAKDRFIPAAERLFAERGIDRVSMRQINIAAGYRNVSALHYHFGSRVDLIAEILSRRMHELDEARLEMLAELEAEGADLADLYTILRVYLEPIWSLGGEDGNPDHFIPVLAQMLGHPEIRIAEILRDRHDAGLRKLACLTMAALPYVPEAIMRRRIRLMLNLSIQSMSHFIRFQRQNPDRNAEEEKAKFMAVLTDMLAGGLSAPVRECGDRLQPALPGRPGGPG